MARTRLAHNVANRRQQQLTPQQHHRAAARKEQQRVTATKHLEICRPRYRDIEMNVRRCAVFCPRRKRVYYN